MLYSKNRDNAWIYLFKLLENPNLKPGQFAKDSGISRKSLCDSLDTIFFPETFKTYKDLMYPGGIPKDILEDTCLFMLRNEKYSLNELAHDMGLTGSYLVVKIRLVYPDLIILKQRIPRK